MSCEAIQQRLSQAMLARHAASAADLAHAEACRACGAHAGFLRGLSAELDALAAPELPPATLAASRTRALQALREQRERRGFVRALARALGLASIALPVAVLHAWLVGWGATALLGAVLPAPLLLWLGAVYFGSLALAMGVLYGSIPLAVALARRPRPELA